MEQIEHVRKRRATPEMKQKDIMKKAKELQALCGVELAVVVSGEGGAPAAAWPSSDKAAEICRSFRRSPSWTQSPAGNRSKDLLSLTLDKVVKLQKQKSRLEEEMEELRLRNIVLEALAGEKVWPPEGEDEVRLWKVICVMLKEIDGMVKARRLTQSGVDSIK